MVSSEEPSAPIDEVLPRMSGRIPAVLLPATFSRAPALLTPGPLRISCLPDDSVMPPCSCRVAPLETTVSLSAPGRNGGRGHELIPPGKGDDGVKSGCATEATPATLK